MSRSSALIKEKFPIKKIINNYRGFLEGEVMSLENKICDLNSSENLQFSLSKTAKMIISFITNQDEERFKNLDVNSENKEFVQNYLSLILLLSNDKEFKFPSNNNEIINSFYIHLKKKYSVKTVKDTFEKIIIPFFCGKYDPKIGPLLHEILKMRQTHPNLFNFQFLCTQNRLISFISYAINEIISWIEMLVENGRKIGKIENKINEIYLIIDKIDNKHSNYSSNSV